MNCFVYSNEIQYEENFVLLCCFLQKSQTVQQFQILHLNQSYFNFIFLPKSTYLIAQFKIIEKSLATLFACIKVAYDDKL